MLIQKDEFAARTVLERLVETGFVEARGIRKGRVYTLSSKVYRTSRSADYVGQADLDPMQQERKILEYVSEHGQITRKDVSELCRLNDDQASRLLVSLRQMCLTMNIDIPSIVSVLAAAHLISYYIAVPQGHGGV